MKHLKYLNNNIKDLSGKTYLVTGSSTGIGFHVALNLAYKGARVILASKNENHIISAINKIKIECPNALVDYFLFDQASLSSISTFAKKLMDKYEKIDGFAFNAGIFHPKKEAVSEDGFTLTLATNYLGTYYLLSLLNDYFNKCGNIRVCFVGSLVFTNKDTTNIYKNLKKTELSLYKQYAISKRAVMELAFSLSKRRINEDILSSPKYNVMLVCPGVADSNIIKYFPRVIKPLAHFVMKLISHSTSKAALPLTIALAKEGLENGTYIVPRGLFEIRGYPKVKKIPEILDKQLISLVKKVKVK